MGNTTFFHGLAKRRAAFAFLLPVLLFCVFAGLTCTAFLGGCTQSETVATATAIPQPSADVSATIRTRVAAKVKALVQAHPTASPYLNDAAKVCFEISGVKLPDPVVLKALFAVGEGFAPKATQPEIDKVLGPVLDTYTADYPTASAVQGGSKNYLTLLGEGIQDGVKAAGVSEAP